jgi:Peptidase family S41/N-terminal domain of Peptidase_S41 in eukaryotic IRBP
MQLKSLILASVACVSAPLLAQAAPSTSPAATASKPAFDKADAEKAVTELATALEENFVFPDAGKKYAAMLRANLAKGAYASFADAPAFADKVTEDLQAVHKDGHLRLRVAPAEQQGQAQAPNGGPPTANDVTKAGWLAPGVAYIDFDGFPGNEATLAEVRKFLDTHKDAKHLIIDARHNGGGGLAEMNLMFEQIFTKPTALVTMDIRQAVEEKHGTPFDPNDPLMRKVEGPATIIRREHVAIPAAKQFGLRDAKVYLLTSKKTFSAAEHLSLSLKRTKRATLIGEATGGGAHFGGMEPMGKGYAAFVPVGRTFDPDTGQSWEGTGVAPDVAVSADKALDEALKLAGVHGGADATLASFK